MFLKQAGSKDPACFAFKVVHFFVQAFGIGKWK